MDRKCFLDASDEFESNYLAEKGNKEMDYDVCVPSEISCKEQPVDVSKLHVITVATHNVGYFEALMESAKLFNIKINIFGWGEKWKGFRWKLQETEKFCRKLKSDDVVMFLDAFDTIILQPAEVILERFYAHGGRLLVNAETVDYSFFRMFFLGAHNCMFKNKASDEWLPIPPFAPPNLSLSLFNSGCYIGYAKDIIKVTRNIPKNVVNDQRWFTKLFLERRHNLHLDAACHIFHIYRGNHALKLLPYEEAKTLCPFKRPIYDCDAYHRKTSSFTSGKKDENIKISDDARNSKKGAKNMKQQLRCNRSYGEIARVPFPKILVDIEAKSSPAVLHIHCRRNVDWLMKELNLPCSTSLFTFYEIAWYCLYSLLGSRKAFLFMIFSLFVLWIATNFIACALIVILKICFVSYHLFTKGVGANMHNFSNFLSAYNDLSRSQKTGFNIYNLESIFMYNALIGVIFFYLYLHYVNHFATKIKHFKFFLKNLFKTIASS